MRGLDPRIHLESETLSKKMDCRVKPGNDESRSYCKLRRDKDAVLRVPAPQAIIDQFGAAPPAMNGVAPGEIVRPRDDGFAKFSQRKPASLVPRVTVSVFVPVEIERSFVESRHRWRRTMRQSIEQGPHFPIAENPTFIGLLVPRK